MHSNSDWWLGKTAYQIYPKSFCDSNGDGIGDIPGIISRLDYLKWLGIDLIWLSPVYESPFIDQGYDISDYYRIASEFGTMADFDHLLAEAKKRGIGIVMDLVINHCSDKHEWFQKALAEPEGPYADYFYFVRGKDGKPPSNMRSYFGGSAWEAVPGTDKYYLHFFAKEQPDLNWENPKLRDEIYKMVNWWLDKGLAGFRIDAIMNIKKDISFPDYPADGADGLARASAMIGRTSGIGAFLGALKQNTFLPHNAFTVGEVFDLDPAQIKEFIGPDGYFSTMFDFSQHLLFGGGIHGWYEEVPYSFAKWRRSLIKSQLFIQNLGLYYANVIENHDEPRGASVYLPDWAKETEDLWRRGTKALAAVTILLRGIPFIYQGQELGMRNWSVSDIGEYDDISTKDQYQVARAAGLSEDEALAVCIRHSRDNARTPFQWDDTENAGFTSGKPWLPVNPNYVYLNAAAQRQDPDSVLDWYRSLIALRHDDALQDALCTGDFVPLYEDVADVLVFLRRGERQCIAVAVNFGRSAVRLTGGLPVPAERVLLSSEKTDTVLADNGNTLYLEPLQAAVVLLMNNTREKE